ncbi:MAG TPA: AraC family transcriptional regulator [Puia sp.]|nr:AraC family transcriptional regulator [Puia sp.]
MSDPAGIAFLFLYLCSMILYIKNMVCPRCILAVEQELKKLTDQPFKVSLGEVTLETTLSEKTLQQFREGLQALGFELLDDQRQRQIEKIKTLLIGLVQKGELEEHFSLSAYLGSALQKEYTTVSRLFSEVEGMTIEQYFILLKIEKVKEWLAYDELTLSEIAWKLGYSSTAHLSAQFKKITGLTPSHFKKTGNSRRTPLDEIKQA